jgi:TRAP-type C4-dicarboxylate transport system substrate-binding protein
MEKINLVIGKHIWDKLSREQQERIQALINQIVEILAEHGF